MRQIYLFFVASIFCNSLFSQRVNKIPPPKPRLVIGIVIEQMRYEYLYRFWDKFDDNGFKKLVNYGAVCKNASFNYLLTQDAPGFATIASGANPSEHGIVADKWYERLKDRMVSSVSDDDARPMPSGDKEERCSPRRLVAATLGDALQQSDPLSKVIGIGFEPESAILLSGHTANAAYWIDEQTGNWISSSYYFKQVPDWVKTFNAKKNADVYMSRPWSPLLNYRLYSNAVADSNQYEIGIGGRTAFPYQPLLMNTNQQKYSALKYTPMGNSYTKDFAIYAAIQESLGKDDHTDLLSISFASTENIGLKWGASSVELEDTYVRLDREIGFFLNFIEQELGKENILVFLTSNHGCSDNTDWLSANRTPAGQFKQVVAIQLLKSYLNALYGEGEWIKQYYRQQFYLNHILIEDSKLSLETVQDKSAQFLIQLSGVANVTSSLTMQRTNYTDGIYRKMLNSFNPKRSGDIMLNLEPNWIEQTTTETCAHNSSYSYDAHVPLVWWGWKVERKIISRSMSMTDIAPTISTMLNISTPNMSSGDVIYELINEH